MSWVHCYSQERYNLHKTCYHTIIGHMITTDTHYNIIHTHTFSSRVGILPSVEALCLRIGDVSLSLESSLSLNDYEGVVL